MSLSFLLILSSCKKVETDFLIDAIKNGHGKKVKICHLTGHGKINVIEINTIKSVNWNYNVIAGNGGIVPYLNIWVTDAAGNYAVISSENNYRGTDFGTRTEWKIFEYGTSTSNFNWLFDGGTGARDNAQYLTLNGSRITLSQLSDRIVIGDPGVYPSPNVGNGAPRGGFGFNLIWGDTQANFAQRSGQIEGLTVTASGVVYTARN